MQVELFSNSIKKQGYIYFHSGAKNPVERYLSTFEPAVVVYKGMIFPSIEHAFQAAKYLYSNKPAEFGVISQLKTALEAKRAGTKGSFGKRGATLNISRWNEHSTQVMRDLVKSRMETDAFYKRIITEARKQNITLLHYERAFGKRGAEPFWGGYFKKSDGTFYGKNMLGRIMMDAAVA